MKYKKLTKEQIILSLDRLTRFKYTKEKYLRVYSDILLSNLIYPKYKKQEIENLDFKYITNTVSTIFNSSLDEDNTDSNINCLLKEHENRLFFNDESTQLLLENNINYKKAIELIDINAPVNLKWLKSILIGENSIKFREQYCLKYPIEKVILVEGITEEILLPAFSKLLGYDFYSKGVHVIGAGGKNQVVKKYYELSEKLRLPIYVLLDKDAEENIRQIKPKLRKFDKVHLVACGEFEDLLPKSLIVKTVNKHFENFLQITENDISQDLPMAKILEEMFRVKGLHEFKKAEFAKLVRNNITEQSDISSEISNIVNEIFCQNKIKQIS